RTIMLHHRWPFEPSGNLAQDQKEIELRSKGIIRGAIAFAGVNFLMAGFFAAVFSTLPPDLNPEEATSGMGLFALLVIVAMFLLFRFAWIYIPLSVGVSFNKYAKLTRPVSFTFSLLALWVVCFVPPVMVMQFIGGVFMGAAGEGDPTTNTEVILAGVRVIFDTLKNILVTAGIAYALMEVFQWKKI
ncbi:MAG: hypothetical protein AAF244_05510, partial [Pseudomonadota bacterium]